MDTQRTTENSDSYLVLPRPLCSRLLPHVGLGILDDPWTLLLLHASALAAFKSPSAAAAVFVAISSAGAVEAVLHRPLLLLEMSRGGQRLRVAEGAGLERPAASLLRRSGRM